MYLIVNYLIDRSTAIKAVMKKKNQQRRQAKEPEWCGFVALRQGRTSPLIFTKGSHKNSYIHHFKGGGATLIHNFFCGVKSLKLIYFCSQDYTN